jgi:hypothetical protein
MRRLAFVLAATAAFSSPALAGYDGMWNVSVTTTRGSCEAASTALAISNGTIVSRDPAYQASGQVGAGGAIVVSLVGTKGNATASGKLDDASGFGVWRGGPCAGTWTAQRR